MYISRRSFTTFLTLCRVYTETFSYFGESNKVRSSKYNVKVEDMMHIEVYNYRRYL